MEDLTPKQIVEHLDGYVIGQAEAKRAVAVAIRNRWRRQRLSPEVAREVTPKNIIMAGPTGVGKTEIARRLARMTGAPFIKVEASKFTEVGYHGRDVESMIRDLVDQSLAMVREEQGKAVRERAEEAANERLVDLMLPGTEEAGDEGPGGNGSSNGGFVSTADSIERKQRVRQRFLERVASGALDDKEVELTLTRRPPTKVMFSGMGLDQMDPSMTEMFEKLIPEKTETKKLKVSAAREQLIEQETDKLLDQDKVQSEAIERAEQSGIVFLDEIDKVATPGSSSGGKGSPDVSRQGVQRDLLPIVEGSQVTTRYGVVHTDHILFVAAGAFHDAAVSDLMPELQGRFPIRVELSPLGKDEFVRILTEPSNALTGQQEALLGVEGLAVRFDAGAVEAMAELAAEANARLEDIGARRLMTIVERVFETVNFDAPERVAAGETELVVTEAFVREQVAGVVADQDLSRFVL
ncbi:MAG: ATP-dependent protease ATPase subunit HslU [Planctomycetota bacterium]